MKHVYMVAIVPRAAHDPAQAVANLVAYYDHDQTGRRDHKRYLTKDELVAHLFEDLWQVGLSREDIPSHPYLQDLDDWLVHKG